MTPALVHLNQPVLLEREVRLQLRLQRHEAMVGDYDDVRALGETGCLHCVEKRSHLSVVAFERGKRLRRVRPVLVGRRVVVEDMEHEEVGLERADDPRGQTCALVVGRRPRHRRRQAALVGVDQMAGRGERTQQRQRLRMPRAEVLGHVVVEVHPHRHGPAHGRRGHPTGPNQAGQRRHLDVARVPIPGARRAGLGIEPGIVDDAVDGRCHTSDHRGVRRVGHRRQDADDAARVGAARRKGAQGRNLRGPGRCVTGGTHAVDGNQHDVTRRLGGHQGKGTDQHGQRQHEHTRPGHSLAILHSGRSSITAVAKW